MSPSISTTLTKIWNKLAGKEYRDAYVSAHISNTVSSQIFLLREKHKWTQKQLAQRAGMGQSRISALEDPNTENFEIDTLKRLASAFDVALTVRFVPFSELAEWTANLSTDKIEVAEFEHDSLDNVSSSSQTNTIIITSTDVQNAFYNAIYSKPKYIASYARASSNPTGPSSGAVDLVTPKMKRFGSTNADAHPLGPSTITLDLTR